MKKITITLLSLLAVGCFVFSGCSESEARGVSSIEKTATNGLVDTYTVYYTDGTTSTFEVTNGQNGTDGANGQDGKNGENITIEALYDKYKEEYGEISYADFLALYMTFENKDYTVIGDCLRSSAKVYTEFTEVSYIYRPMGGVSTTTSTSVYTGSSVIYKIDEDYTYFITNYHVVYNANATSAISEKIYCYLYGSEDEPTAISTTEYDYGEYAIACDFIGGSVTYDIALLKAKTSDVKAINENVQAVEFAEDYYVGQTAIAIGNPDDAGLSVTKGVVSVDNDYITLNIDGTTREYRSIRMDTALYSGNSGGGLFNEKGELIGINNAGNGDEQNINYAIPLSIVKGVAKNVMHYHSDGNDETNGVYKATIGITVLSEKSRYVYNETAGYGEIVENIILSTVESCSIAETIGLQTGDRLISIKIDNTVYALNRYFDIADGLLSLTVGTQFSFVYQRSGEEYTTQTYTITASDILTVA